MKILSPSVLMHAPSGLFVSCFGWKMELSQDVLSAPLFTPQNTSKERPDNFHVNFFRAAIKEYGRKNLKFVPFA